ncbi:MAG TPA: hypothetical protein VIL08_00760 [Limnochorda sp.]
MPWIARLVWLAVSLYGSWVIGRQLFKTFRRRAQLLAFGDAQVSLIRLRLELVGLWLVATLAWALLLAAAPLPFPPVS